MGEANLPIARLIREMRRRRIFRTAALYIVGTWLVLRCRSAWHRATDLAGLMVSRDKACRLLGMAAATAAAVACIKEALAKPSYFMSHLDPYLPHFDPIRDEPKFIELIAEIETDANSL